jgi:NAD(P)-dependent dehydrogenase (short-subunit alcohol dehydrogenase family)
VGVSDKVVLVTGASAGIGWACADHLARSGWTVVGASRRGTSGNGWRGMVIDVDDDASVSAGVATVLEDHGHIDALLACAGWGLAGAAEQTSLAEAKAQFETNFWGAVRAANAVLPIFRGQGHGRLVFMSSLGGVFGIPFQSFYSASKFALEGYGESLAYEVAPFGIHVTLIEPGNFKTDFTQSRRKVEVAADDPYGAAQTKAITVMERDEVKGADPKDVAKVAERVLVSARPPRRVSVGKFDERIGILGKRILPFRVFERAAKGPLGV